MNYRGPWNEGVAYDSGDVVQFQDKTWMTTQRTWPSHPPGPLTWTVVSALAGDALAKSLFTGSGAPAVGGNRGDLYLDAFTQDIWVMEDSWVRVEDSAFCGDPTDMPIQPLKKEWSKADEDFLRALSQDVGRIVTHMRRGALVNDRDQTLLELTPQERKAAPGKPHEAMYQKLVSLFCTVCQERANEGLCAECEARITDDLRRIAKG